VYCQWKSQNVCELIRKNRCYAPISGRHKLSMNTLWLYWYAILKVKEDPTIPYDMWMAAYLIKEACDTLVYIVCQYSFIYLVINHSRWLCKWGRWTCQRTAGSCRMSKVALDNRQVSKECQSIVRDTLHPHIQLIRSMLSEYTSWNALLAVQTACFAFMTNTSKAIFCPRTDQANKMV
jgi:hypothetical protein